MERCLVDLVKMETITGTSPKNVTEAAKVQGAPRSDVRGGENK